MTRQIVARTTFTSFVLIAAIAIVRAQSPDVLDLTTWQSSALEKPDAFWPSRSASSHPNYRTLPLRLTIVQTDKPTYRVRESGSYRVRIKNLGNETFALPWEPDWTRIIEVPGTPIFQYWVQLEVHDATIRQSGLPVGMPQVVYGSPSTPSSFKMIGPSESVDIVAPMILNIDRDLGATILQSLPRQIELTVKLIFAGQPDPARPFRPIESEGFAVGLDSQ